MGEYDGSGESAPGDGDAEGDGPAAVTDGYGPVEQDSPPVEPAGDSRATYDYPGGAVDRPARVSHLHGVASGQVACAR